MAGRAEAPSGNVDHQGAVRPGHVGGAVGRSVVGDDRAVARRHAGEDPRQGPGLVEARQDDVDGRRGRTLLRTDSRRLRVHAAVS